MRIPKDMMRGSIHKTNNNGNLIIIDYSSYKNVIVRFIGTGYIRSSDSSSIRKGNVKDVMFANVYGVGFLGEGKYKTRMNGKATKQYFIWQGILQRSYCELYHRKKPTYKNVTVCKEWHNFQNFAKWFDENYIDGLHLDKDMKQRGVDKKVYSPKTCIFITASENSIESAAKTYHMTNPNGDVIEIYNMAEFCRGTNLEAHLMSKVSIGELPKYEGWTKKTTN